MTFKKAIYLLFVFMLSSAYVSAPVLSLSQEQKDLYDSGVLYYDIEGGACNFSPALIDSSLEVLRDGSEIYILGDSIAVQSQNELQSELTAAGYSISKIEADSGRAISTDTAGGDPTALEAVAADAVVISGSDAVVIALGTNSGTEDLNVQIPALIEAVRATNFSGPIYWVNLFYTINDGPSLRNAAIASQATSQNYTVIDTVSAGIQLVDQIHPEVTERAKFAQTIVSGLQSLNSGGTSPVSEAGNCVCGGSTPLSLNQNIDWGEGVWGPGSEIYTSNLSPPYTKEQWAIHVLRNISRKSGIPESSLVTRDKVVSLIAWSLAEGGGVNGNNGSFNPLNTKLSHSDLGGVNQGNAATDSNSQGYPDFDRGVEAITRGLFNGRQKRIATALLDPSVSALDFIEAVAGDFVAEPYGTSDQNNIINRLEDIYPGDGVYAAASITGWNYGGGIGDRAQFVRTKQGTLENVQENYAEYASRLLDSFGGQPPPSGTPAPLVFGSGGAISDTYTGGACEQSETGASVNAEGYAFPLEPQNRSVGGVTEGQTESTHWDETDAFDLFSTDSASVYSIYSGTPVTINTNFNGVPGCSSIQFEANDGYFYWYGHLKNVEVQEGVEIEAGVKMAEIADESFGTDCTGGGGPHLHIDRGCSINGVPQRGGNDNCRDPEFIPFLSRLYEELPIN